MFHGKQVINIYIDRAQSGTHLADTIFHEVLHAYSMANTGKLTGRDHIMMVRHFDELYTPFYRELGIDNAEIQSNFNRLLEQAKRDQFYSNRKK